MEERKSKIRERKGVTERGGLRERERDRQTSRQKQKKEKEEKKKQKKQRVKVSEHREPKRRTKVICSYVERRAIQGEGHDRVSRYQVRDFRSLSFIHKLRRLHSP